jgi:diguanylate cyclase (GGDEF)-like protein
MYLLYLPAILLILFALLITGLWLADRERNRHMALIAGGFTGYSFAMFVQVASLPPEPPFNAVSSALLYSIGMALLGAGMMQRSKLTGFALPLGLMGLALVAMVAWFAYVHDDLVMRIYCINFSLGAMAAYGVWRLRASIDGTFGDRTMFWVLVGLTAQFFLRPLLTAGSIGNPDPTEFGNTLFWMVTSYAVALFSVIVGVAVIMVSAADTLAIFSRERDTDPLTGLNNRRGLESRAARLLAHAASQPIALIICDIDHFKAVNDRHGHAAGDVLLRLFAQTLLHAVRPDELLARLGGEEFVVLAACTDAQGGFVLAERIRRAIADADFGGLGHDLTITCSLGVVEIGPGESLWQAVRRADKLLYGAKHAGRNRTHTDDLAHVLPPVATP